MKNTYLQSPPPFDRPIGYVEVHGTRYDVWPTQEWINWMRELSKNMLALQNTKGGPASTFQFAPGGGGSGHIPPAPDLGG